MAQVVEQDPLISHAANGVTTLFAFPFQVLLSTDLVVLLDGVPTTTGFSVSGLGVQSGGSITFSVAPANGVEITIYRDTEIRRDTEYQSNGDFLSPVVNADFNRPLLILQEIASGGKAPVASVRAPRGEVLTQLPAAAARANKVLSFDSSGQPVVVAPTSGDATDLAVQIAASDDATEGAGMVGYNPAAVTYTGRTAGKAMSRRVCVMDWIPDNLWSAIEARTSTVDVWSYFQACAVANPYKELWVPAGLFRFTRGFYLTTGQSLVGERGGTLIKALSGSWVGTTGVTGTAPFVFNQNNNTTTLTDKDTTVSGVEFDYDTVTVIGGGAHAIRFRAVNRPLVEHCIFTGGENATAFLACKDTLVDACEAYNNINCFYDHWDGTIGATVRNCVGRNDAGIFIAQGIQFTGTGSALEDRDSQHFLSSGNRLFGVRGATGLSSAIIFNANDAGSSVMQGQSVNDYVEDSDNGLVCSGSGGHHTVRNLTLKDVDQAPVYVQDEGGGTTPATVVVSGVHLIDCTNAAAQDALIKCDGGANHSITGIKVTNTGAAAYENIVLLSAAVSNATIQIEAGADGTVGRYSNLGTGNHFIDSDAELLTFTQFPRFATAGTPSAAASAGLAGTVKWDTSYIYVCTSNGAWKRAALSTW